MLQWAKTEVVGEKRKLENVWSQTPFSEAERKGCNTCYTTDREGRKGGRKCSNITDFPTPAFIIP